AELREHTKRFEEHDKKFNEIMAELREHTKRFEEHDKKFNEIMAELREHTKRFEEHDKKFNEIMAELREHTKRFEEHDKKFNEIMAELREHTKRFEEHDKKFNEIIGRIDRVEERVEILGQKIEVTIGSMGRRWGSDLERTVLNIFKETVESKGIEPGKVEKFRFKDEDGAITGEKGKIIDVDVLIRDDKLYVIEVKSYAEIDHVEHLYEKAGIVEKILKKEVDKIFIITVNIEREAYDRAKEIGVEVICSNILD
ncbi:MAG: DUF3782 domain-containing protein, partial [Candidatus Bathyarchaeia archaeon]